MTLTCKRIVSLCVATLILLVLTPFCSAFAGPDLKPGFKPGFQSGLKPWEGPDQKNCLKISAKIQFDYAQHCFLRKDYLRAIFEYKRFIYFFSEDKKVQESLYKIGMCYFNAEHFKDAANAFQEVIERYEGTDFSIQSYFMKSRSYIELGNLSNAVANLHNLIALTDDINIRDRAYYDIGWFYLEMSWFDGAFENAQKYFSKVSANNREKYKVIELIAGLEAAGEGGKEKIPRKSPAVAGLLSVLPGGGYLYCERYQDAFISFLLNTGLMLAAYESFDDGNDALGGVITFVGFGFYAGNIYGATTSAHKYNRNKVKRFIESLKKEEVDFSTRISDKGVALCFNYSF
jgi:tetratricopeptide (TPR) repeat protein